MELGRFKRHHGPSNKANRLLLWMEVPRAKKSSPWGAAEAVGFSESGVATLMESNGEVLMREGVGGTGVGYRRRGSGGIQGRIY